MVKRRRASTIDWARAVATVMARHEDLGTQTALGKRAGMAQSTIGRILRGDVDPQTGNLERIARAFGLSLLELGQMGQEGNPITEPLSLVELIDRSTRVALISWEKADSFVEVSERLPPREGDEWMPRPKLSGDKTFALQVRGESMEPVYQHGDIIFVDPDAAPKHGKDAVVRLNDRHDVAFRRVVIEGGVMYLRPANPNWPGKVVGILDCPGARIIGVVIGKWVDK